jgi:hypothetical protein
MKVNIQIELQADTAWRVFTRIGGHFPRTANGSDRAVIRQELADSQKSARAGARDCLKRFNLLGAMAQGGVSLYFTTVLKRIDEGHPMGLSRTEGGGLQVDIKRGPRV